MHTTQITVENCKKWVLVILFLLFKDRLATLQISTTLPSGNYRVKFRPFRWGAWTDDGSNLLFGNRLSWYIISGHQLSKTTQMTLFHPAIITGKKSSEILLRTSITEPSRLSLRGRAKNNNICPWYRLRWICRNPNWIRFDVGTCAIYERKGGDTWQLFPFLWHFVQVIHFKRMSTETRFTFTQVLCILR